MVDRLRTMCADVHHTAPYHSSSNGLTERGIGVLDQKECTLRIARNMPECFREDAWNFSIFLTNIFPLRYEGNWHTDPHTQYKGKTFDYSKLRVPFSVCYVYNPQRIKGQDVRKGRKGIFVVTSRIAMPIKFGFSVCQTMLRLLMLPGTRKNFNHS